MAHFITTEAHQNDFEGSEWTREDDNLLGPQEM